MSGLLLDTSIVIQWAINPKHLKDEVRVTIANGRNLVFVSAATAWEIAIKTKIGKLAEVSSVKSLLSENRFIELPISFEHAEETIRLPMHHRDPFDRLLIAQARCNSLTLVTSDAEIQKYDVVTLAA